MKRMRINNWMKIRVLLGGLLLSGTVNGLTIDPPKQEVRAVWLSTVYGLDWPSRPISAGFPIAAQQKELMDMLDKLADANFNTIFIQTRLRGDVIYPSSIEPFSRVFSGKCGVSPGYDPLAFVIEECHKRGMECHAWLVTYPIGTESSVKSQGKHSVVKKRPKLCVKHQGEWYLDPGLPETADYILSLAQEVVNRYDVDGIHFDYIRYPEQANRFNDKKTHTKYGKKQELSNWRRENINKTVARIYDWVKQVKPWVQVSSSPLGKYARIPRVPNAGWTAYESVFQDAALWMKNGKQDMLVPMMYYTHDNYFPFVDNWTENAYGRMFIAGLGGYRLMENEGDWLLNDLTDQIDYARYYGGGGVAIFRAKNVTDNLKGIYDELCNNYFKYPAQLPPLSWLNDSVPPSPGSVHVSHEGDQLVLTWEEPEASETPLTYTVYYSYSDSINQESSEAILATGIHSRTLYLTPPTDEAIFTFTVTASSRYHIESLPAPETFYYHCPFTK